MKAFIIDDEKPAREELAWLLEQCDGVEVVGEAKDADAARRSLQEADPAPDVVFLDINMPGIDGIRLAESVGELEPAPRVVFVTAHEEYAVDAFGVDAVDYLLKPVRLERLQKSVERVRQRIAGGTSDDAPDDKQNDKESARSLDRLSVRDDDGYRVVDAEDILLFESVEGDVFVETATGRFPTDFSLKFLDARLDAESFYRCHRSYIVRIDAIESIVPAGAGTYRLYLSSDHETSAPLARSRAGELKRRIPWSANVVDE